MIMRVAKVSRTALFGDQKEYVYFAPGAYRHRREVVGAGEEPLAHDRRQRSI